VIRVNGALYCLSFYDNDVTVLAKCAPTSHAEIFCSRLEKERKTVMF
jgi:hypothetical protein